MSKAPEQYKSPSLCVLLFIMCCALPLACGGEARTTGDFQAWLPVPYTRDMGDAELNALLDKAKNAGVDGVHTQADWGQLEPQQDNYRWAFMDRFVNNAGARGLKVTMQLTAAPKWVAPEGMWGPPRGSADLAAWRDFSHDLVERYGTRVARYEMWNEPNHPTFWPSGPDPAEYAALLRAGYLGAKDADPDVRVTGGMLSHNDMGYFNALYTAIRRYPDAAANDDFFDELAVHPYAFKGTTPLAPDDPTDATWQGPWGPINNNFWGYRKMRKVLVDHGDSHKKIYLGEFGYGTLPHWAQPITDEQRAGWLKRAFAVANNDSSYVTGLSWYSYYTDAERGYNLVNPDTLSESATFRALREVNSSATRTLYFAPAADARVQEGSPNRNFGSSTTLTADGGNGTRKVSFLRFKVSGVDTDAVEHAELRLYVKEGGGSYDGPGVRRAANAWSEGGVTWNDRPAFRTPLQGDKGAVSGASWMAFNVTNLVGGDGTVTLAVQTASTDGAYMVSREGTNKPRLVVEAGS